MPSQDELEARSRYLFAEAARASAQQLRSLFAEHAAKGLLKSGGTIKRAVRIAESTSGDAVRLSLKAVDDLSPAGGRRRAELARALRKHFNDHFDHQQEVTNEALERVGLPSALTTQEFTSSRDRLLAEIDQYQRGFTAAKPLHWKERHPLVLAGLTTIIGALFGALVQALVTASGCPS